MQQLQVIFKSGRNLYLPINFDQQNFWSKKKKVVLLTQQVLKIVIFLTFKNSIYYGFITSLICQSLVLIDQFEVLTMLFYSQPFLLTEFGLHQVDFRLQKLLVSVELSSEQDRKLMVDRRSERPILIAWRTIRTICILLRHLII